MPRGDVYRDIEFDFSDGEQGIKRIIQLNQPSEVEPHIFARTTSKFKRKYLDGCCSPLPAFFLPCNAENCFDLNTLIQLHELHEYNQAELLSKKVAGTVEHLGTLSSLCLNNLLFCVECHKHDIDTDYFRMITRMD